MKMVLRSRRHTQVVSPIRRSGGTVMTTVSFCNVGQSSVTDTCIQPPATQVVTGYVFALNEKRPKSVRTEYVFGGPAHSTQPGFNLGRIFEATEVPGAYWGRTKIKIGPYSFWVVGYFNPTGPANSALQDIIQDTLYCGEVVIFEAGTRVPCLKRPRIASSSNITVKVGQA